MSNEELIREARSGAMGNGTLLRDLARALEEAEAPAHRCACRFPSARAVVQGERVPLAECLYHSTLRARVPSAEAVAAVKEALRFGAHFHTCPCRSGSTVAQFGVAGPVCNCGRQAPLDTLRANWPPAWGPWAGAGGGA